MAGRTGLPQTLLAQSPKAAAAASAAQQAEHALSSKQHSHTLTLPPSDTPDTDDHVHSAQNTRKPYLGM